MNTFFTAYLETKGFKTRFLAATLYEANGEPGKEETYMLIAVKVNSDMYIVDVGLEEVWEKAIRVYESESVIMSYDRGYDDAIKHNNHIYIKRGSNDKAVCVENPKKVTIL